MVETLAHRQGLAGATPRIFCILRAGKNNLRTGLSTIRTTGTDVRYSIEKGGENW